MNNYLTCPIVILQYNNPAMAGKKPHYNHAAWFKNFLLLVLILVSFSAVAQQQTIAVETKDIALVLQTDKDNRPGIIYFGKKLLNSAEYTGIAQQYRRDDDNKGIGNNAYTPAGTWNLLEPAIQVTHADGNKSLELL
ncbi:MAG: hypothetical protein ABIN97_10460, partial [Ginsengibacter sp.]